MICFVCATQILIGIVSPLKKPARCTSIVAVMAFREAVLVSPVRVVDGAAESIADPVPTLPLNMLSKLTSLGTGLCGGSLSAWLPLMSATRLLTPDSDDGPSFSLDRFSVPTTAFLVLFGFVLR